MAVGATKTAVYFISRHSALLGSGKLRVTVLDLETGKEEKQYSLSGDGDISPENSIVGLVTKGLKPFIYLLQHPFKTVKISPLGLQSFASFPVENQSGEDIKSAEIHGPASEKSPTQFLVHFQTATKAWGDVYHIDGSNMAIKTAFRIPEITGPDAFSSSSIGDTTYFTRITSTFIKLYSSQSPSPLGNWGRSGDSDNSVQHAAAEVVSPGEGRFAIRVAQTSLSGELSLLRNGETSWTRPEMLATITAAAWASTETEPELIHELEAEGHENPVAAYIHRVQRHIADLSHFPEWLIRLPQRLATVFQPMEGDPRDSFFKGKVLIVATHDGRVLSLDPLKNGKILWKYQPVDQWPRWEIAAIKINKDQATVYLDRAGSLVLNVRTGALVKLNRSGFETKGVAEFDTPTGAGVIRTTHSGNPFDFDGTGQVATEGSYLVSWSDDGKVSGWSAKHLSDPLWTFGPAPGERIINVVARPSHDPVASIGKVLGDRSVLYKYLNPNLALITSISSTALTFYLIEAVTGAVLFTTTHEGVDGTAPIPSVVSENWLAYSYYGQVGASNTESYQLVIHELYESSVPNDRGPLGSVTNQSAFDFGAIVQPSVISQSFLLSEKISSMAVTQTRQGITTRQLLCYLPESNAIGGLPRPFLDPRRPEGRDPTSSEAEEGLFRYNPVLEFDAKWLLTHSRDVVGVKQIITTSTELESTSLVFAYGHDVFGTRLSPSMAFDILGKGFNKVQLVLTVVALWVGVLVLRPIVTRKQVGRWWKM